jgi:protein-tyrosine phosphatase
MRILFICLGNICRSPVVEVVARSEFARAGLDITVASAGTGDYHVGHGADPRAIASARARGYDLTAHRARQLVAADFAAFDAVLAMDNANLRTLAARCPQRYNSKLALFLPFAGMAGPEEVPDPYFGEADGFEHVIELARNGAGGLLERFKMAHNIG